MQDGRVARFDVPDGTTPEQAKGLMESHFSDQQPSARDKFLASLPPERRAAAEAKPVFGREGFNQALKQELQANPDNAKYAAFGTAASDLYQGTKQLFGAGDREAIATNNIIKDESPKSALLGNVATFASGGMAAPILNTLKGATIAGGVTGLLSPTENENVALGKLENAGKGAAFSFLGNKAGQKVGEAVGAARKAIADKISTSSIKNAAFDAARAAGYDIPANVTNPGWVNRTLESLAGKEAVKQSAAAAPPAV